LSLLAFLDVSAVFAQSIHYGKITGKVMLENGEAVPGVGVELNSDALISGKRTTITSPNGTYVFLNLPVGKYKIRATLQGFKTVVQKGIVVSAGGAATVNLVMEAGELQEEVTVSAAPPVVDARTSTIDTKMDKEMLEKLPTSRDAFYDLSLTTPGMFEVGKDASWLPSPTAYGGATNENIFLVNGVDTTNPRGSSWGSMVNVNYSAVEEVRVISLGSKAEYGSFSGVAIDVLTKSGSNELHGNVGFYSMLGKSADNTPAAGTDLGKDFLHIDPADNIVTQSRRDMEASLTLGGPLVKNKAWFYFGYNYVNRKTHEPNFDPTKDYSGNYADLKITAEPVRQHRLWVAYHFEKDKSSGTSWGSLNWDPTLIYTTKRNSHSLSSQWQWYPSNNTFFSAKYLGFWTNDNPSIPSDAPDHPGYINWWKAVPSDMGVNGSFHYIEAQKSSRNTLQADVSHYAEDFLGEHDIKFGVQYTRGRGNWFGGYFHGYANYAYLYRWTYNIQYMQDWYGDTGLLMYVRRPHRNPYLTVRTADTMGAFFDDQWTIGNRLTINAGIRFDRMTSKFGAGKVYEMPTDPQNVNDLKVLRERQGSDNVFDFKTWSPRVGLTYVLTKDNKTVFRASYGRYYSPISVENLGQGGPDMQPYEVERLMYELPFIDLDGDGIVYGPDVIAATRLLDTLTPYEITTQTIDPSWHLSIADNLKNQHTDQFTLSLERELFKDLSVNASYIHRETKNMIVRWPLNSVTQEPWEYERVPYTTEEGVTVDLYGVVWKDYDGDGDADNDDVAWVHNHMDFEWRNMPKMDGKTPRRLYQGLQFTINKRYSNRWQLLVSALFSKTDGMAARSKRQDINIEGPNIVNDAWLNGLNQIINNMEGPLPYTPKFELKLSGSYRIPNVEIDLGFRFRFHTGRPVWPLEAFPSRFNWGGAPNSVIATGETYIVAIDPTKPDYLPSQKILDLHLERAFELGPGSIHFVLDFFNIFNESSVTNALWKGDYGRVVGVSYPGRKIKLSLLYDF